MGNNNTKHRLPMIYKILPILVFVLSSFNTNKIKTTRNTKFPISTLKSKTTNRTFEDQVILIYSNLQSNNLALPKLESFKKATYPYFCKLK